MNCASCGFEAAADFAFCPKCGTRLAAATAQTSALPPASASAARSSASTDAHSDRRPVTVLFADLSGFTTLGERLDPEDVRALQNDLFREMSDAIERFEGFVEKYVGDAVMGVFGAPVAHEDDPERALRAALLMRERIQVLSERWARRIGSPLALHIGVNTGHVVAGQIGSGAGAAYAVTGDAVNTAARLQSTADSGQILASRSTYTLTQHVFDFEALGEVRLKGKTEPVPIYRVIGALSVRRPARGLHVTGREAPFVGRDRELRDLVTAFERMLAGETQVVTLLGEAGSGKSRLLSEFLERLEQSGQLGETVVRRAVCSSVGEHTYGVPAALLRDAYGATPEDAPAVARQKFVAGLQALGTDAAQIEHLALFLGYLLGFETGDARLRQIDPEHVERHIFLAVQEIVERRLQHAAVVLVVEDLHWADAASVKLLRFLVERLQDRRFMLLVTHRTGHDVAKLTVARDRQTVVRLQPFSAADGSALLDELIQATAPRLGEELRLRILEHSGGNPLFIEEMVRALAGGVLLQEHGQWVYRPDKAESDVPLTIHGLLLARIDRLPAGVRQALQEAAVVGPIFAEALLRMVASDAQSLDQALAALVDAELLVEAAPPAASTSASPERRYRFRHGLFHETAYQNLLVSRRSELHTRVGHALEQMCGSEPHRLEDLEALGHHFRLSADKLRGARYLVSAGDGARAIYANADAIRHYEHALAIFASAEDVEAQRLSVCERVGDLLPPAGQRAEGLRHLWAAHAGYVCAGERLAQARVLRKIGALHWDAGDRAEATRFFHEGLALTEDQPDRVERAHLYQEMGQLAFRSGDNEQAMRWAQEALAHAERLWQRVAVDDEHRDAAAALSLALNTLGVAFARLNRMDEAVGHLLRSVAVAREADLLQIECRGIANLGVLYSTLDPARAIETCERGLETAKRIGDLGLQSRLYTNLAVAYCALTNRCDEDGIGAAHTAIELDRRLGQLDHLAVPLVVLGQIYQCHGDPELAMGYYREAMTLAESVGEPQLLFPCYDGLATLFLDAGDDTQAEHYMRKAREVCQRAGLEPDDLTVLPFLS